MATVDFKTLLSKPAEEIKAPVPLPAGTFYGTIKGFEFKESKEKKTPYVEFTIAFNSAGEDIPPEDMEGVDLSKKTMRKAYYLTDDAAYRLRELTDSCDIPFAGRSTGEIIQDTVGQPVIIEVEHRMDTRNPLNPPFNDIKSLKGHK